VILGLSILLLAYRSLRPAVDVPIGHGLFKAVLLTIGTSIPLLVTDQLLTQQLMLRPLLRLPVILTVFAASFLIISRTLSIFEETDFSLLETALPTVVRGPVRFIQHLLVPKERQ
jgi:hypothetical protein